VKRCKKKVPCTVSRWGFHTLSCESWSTRFDNSTDWYCLILTLWPSSSCHCVRACRLIGLLLFRGLWYLLIAINDIVSVTILSSLSNTLPVHSIWYRNKGAPIGIVYLSFRPSLPSLGLDRLSADHVTLSVVLKSGSRNHLDRIAECFTIYGIYKQAVDRSYFQYQNYHSRSSPHTPNYLAQDMHFSFVLTVVAAFAALATSKSVDACIDQGGLCDSTSAAGEVCCKGLTCGVGVSIIHPLLLQDSIPWLTPCALYHSLRAAPMELCTATKPLLIGLE